MENKDVCIDNQIKEIEKKYEDMMPHDDSYGDDFVKEACDNAIDAYNETLNDIIMQRINHVVNEHLLKDDGNGKPFEFSEVKNAVESSNDLYSFVESLEDQGTDQRIIDTFLKRVILELVGQIMHDNEVMNDMKNRYNDLHNIVESYDPFAL